MYNFLSQRSLNVILLSLDLAVGNAWKKCMEEMHGNAWKKCMEEINQEIFCQRIFRVNWLTPFLQHGNAWKKCMEEINQEIFARESSE